MSDVPTHKYVCLCTLCGLDGVQKNYHGEVYSLNAEIARLNAENERLREKARAVCKDAYYVETGNYIIVDPTVIDALRSEVEG